MAGKSDTFEFSLLRLVFNGVAISTLAATAGTTQLWVGLHTADPGDAGSTANEGGYATYTRVPTDRSTQGTTPYGWAITSGTSAALASASPVGTLSFPQNTAVTTGTFTHATIYMSSAISSSGALYYGAISPTIAWQQNTTPQLTSGSSITED